MDQQKLKLAHILDPCIFYVFTVVDTINYILT